MPGGADRSGQEAEREDLHVEQAGQVCMIGRML